MSRGKKGSFLGSAGLVAVAALVSPGGALAQTATGPAAHGAALEEIVVTARKRAESLQETPDAVSAVSAEALEHNRLLRIDDLQKAVRCCQSNGNLSPLRRTEPKLERASGQD